MLCSQLYLQEVLQQVLVEEMTEFFNKLLRLMSHILRIDTLGLEDVSGLAYVSQLKPSNVVAEVIPVLQHK